MTTQRIDDRYVLTTEHPASSYGQPVLVDSSGQAYGPDDAIEPAFTDIFGETCTPTARMLVANWARSYMPEEYVALDKAILRFAGLATGR